MRDRSRLADAVRLLAEELRRRAVRHPHGHLVGRRDEAVAVRLDVPFGGGADAAGAAVERLDVALDAALAGLLSHRAAFVPGRAYCLRCREAECEHAEAPSPRHVFTGYGPSGMPRFGDFGQWLLDRGDTRVDRLYDERAELLAHVASGAELTADLLPAFRDRRARFRLHGQVAAGWYRVRGDGGSDDPFAVTFQVVSTMAGRGRRRFALNVCGRAPGGGALTALRERLGAIPWSGSVRWAQSVLARIEQEHAGRRGPRGGGQKLDRRVDGLLAGLARRIERGERSRGRRTRHAEERHAEGTRPTRMALTDLARAGEEQLLLDARRGTLVVVGERGRTHFFNEAGKLVTSVRYPPAAIARRRRSGRWTAAPTERVDRLRERLGRG